MPAQRLHIHCNLFIISKNWKQPKCVSTGECINKVWYTHKVEYHLWIKRNGLLKHISSWRNLKCIYAKGKRPDTKTIHYVKSIYMTFWNRWHFRNRNRTSNGQVGVHCKRAPGNFQQWLKRSITTVVGCTTKSIFQSHCAAKIGKFYFT